MTGNEQSSGTRPVGWVKAARKAFDTFPETVRNRASVALTIAAEGGKSDISKPLRGVGHGVMQIAIRHRTNTWRVVYVVECAGIWVLHAFQKKSKTGIKTSKQDLDLVSSRLARLKQEVA